MKQWKRDLALAHTQPLAAYASLGWKSPEEEGIRAVARDFGVRIPQYYLDLIDTNDPEDPIARQCLPSLAELWERPDDRVDAVGDVARSPVPGVVQKHDNRVILLVSNTCSMYCRFCFRRPVGSGPSVLGLRDGLRQAFQFLEQQPHIREVILSGGDPLMLEDESLGEILERLRGIPHLEILRIHSRMPVTLPSRVTSELCEVLRRYRPLVLVTHFNHPRELTPQATTALGRLADAGIPLLNQTVLLRGVNDRVETLADLSWSLLRHGVTPYYLHHCDLTPGTGPFRVPIREGLSLMADLTGRVPGHGLPRYMLDIPGGFGKIQIDGPWVRALEPGRWQLTTPQGHTIVYQEETGRAEVIPEPLSAHDNES